MKKLHIQKCWDDYRQTVDAEKIPANILEELREAFYAGAIAVFSKTLTYKDQRVALEIRAEIEWHMRQLKSKVEANAKNDSLLQ